MGLVPEKREEGGNPNDNFVHELLERKFEMKLVAAAAAVDTRTTGGAKKEPRYSYVLGLCIFKNKNTVR